MQRANAHDLPATDDLDGQLFEDANPTADLARRLAACESKLTAARERMDRLEEDNHRLKEQNRLLQERVLTMRLLGPHGATGRTEDAAGPPALR